VSDKVLIPPLDFNALPVVQYEAVAEFLRQRQTPGFHRPEDGAFVHGCSHSLTAWADASATDLIVTAGAGHPDGPVQVRISPAGEVTETETSIELRAKRGRAG
jgi:hypothetical protein